MKRFEVGARVVHVKAGSNQITKVDAQVAILS